MDADQIASALQAELSFVRSPNDRKAQIPSKPSRKQNQNIEAIAKRFSRESRNDNAQMIIRAIYGMTERRSHVLAEISQADRLEWNGLPMSPWFKGGNHSLPYRIEIRFG